MVEDTWGCERFERMEMRPRRAGRRRSTPNWSLLHLHTSSNNAGQRVANRRPLPTALQPLASGQTALSLNKHRRWELRETLTSKWEGAEALLDLQTPELRVSCLHFHVKPFAAKELCDLDRVHYQTTYPLHHQEHALSYSTVTRNAEGEDEYKVKRARKTYALADSLIKPPRPPKKRGRAARENVEPVEPVENVDDRSEALLLFPSPTTSSDYYNAAIRKLDSDDFKRETKFLRRLQNRKALDQELSRISDTLTELDSDAPVANDQCTSDEEELVAPTTRPLTDYITPAYSPKAKKKRTKSTSLSSLISPSDWYYATPDEFPSTANTTTDEEEWETVSTPLPAVHRLPAVRLLMPNSELDPDRLQEQFGEAYFECGVSPRRFGVWVSSAVAETARVAQTTAAMESVDPRVAVVLEVEPPSIGKMFRRMHRRLDGDDWSFVNVWINGAFTAAISNVNLDLDLDSEFQFQLGDVLKTVTANLGCLPLHVFTASDASTLPAPHTRAKLTRKFGLIRSITVDASEAQQLILNQSTGSLSSASRDSNQDLNNWDHIHISNQEKDWPDFLVDEEKECGVCFGKELRGAALSCGHYFCEECWSGAAGARTALGHGRVGCLEPGCQELASWTALCGLVPLGLVSRLERAVTESTLLSSPLWAYCPSPRCSRLRRLAPTTGTSRVIRCGCGEEWCRDCGEEAHWPARCGEAEVYRQQLRLNGDMHLHAEERERKVKVKRCPHCSLPMEKGVGCNHMSCRCGQSFCWACGGKWNSGSHYECAANKSKFESVYLMDVTRKPKGAKGALDSETYLRAVDFRKIHLKLRKHGIRDSVTFVTRGAKAAMPTITTDAFLSTLSETGRSVAELLEWVVVSEKGVVGDRLEKGMVDELVSRLTFLLTQLEDCLLRRRRMDARRVEDLDRMRRHLGSLAAALAFRIASKDGC